VILYSAAELERHEVVHWNKTIPWMFTGYSASCSGSTPVIWLYESHSTNLEFIADSDLIENFRQKSLSNHAFKNNNP
jgi:hypothetical protein